MSTHPDQDWLQRSNAQTLSHLERQGRTTLGLVPFLGAGVSQAYELKNWRNLLLDAAPPRVLPQVTKQLDGNDYEGAAETLLQELGSDDFQNMVAASAGDHLIKPFDFGKGTVSLLPLLATGPVVTTNFDRIVEQAFIANRTPFDSVISGPRPDLIVDALHGNHRVLIKLHGDWQDRVGQTFAASQYNENYVGAQPGLLARLSRLFVPGRSTQNSNSAGAKKKRELLASVERLLFSSRSMLFIGASLGPDRTVDVLKQVHEDCAGIRHFTIIAVPKKKEDFEEKERQLQALGVLPLWYQVEPGADHAPEVEKVLADIVELISVQTVPTSEGPASTPPLAIKSAPTLAAYQPLTHRSEHFGRVVRLIEDGRLTFVLGSAIHFPLKFMANDFNARLMQIFECPALHEDRSAITQYIADRHGRENLYVEIRKVLRSTSFQYQATHELFAAWKGFHVPYPTIITTNYDNVLERRLDESGSLYHLLSYQTDGPHRGLFYHQQPDRSVRIIERSQNIRSFSEGFVIVKLNGGVAQGRVRESYATTRLDYWYLAARIQSVLPAAVQQTLSVNSLLFLGHSLREPDIESLVRFAHKDRSNPRSWAVVKDHPGVEYWRQQGVELIEEDINQYMNDLRGNLGKP
jgi:hypothetical protein